MLLAQQIKNYWADLGFDVDIWVEPFRAKPSRHLRPTANIANFAVRSDMIGGWPRQAAKLNSPRSASRVR